MVIARSQRRECGRIRTTVLCVVGVALAMGGYVVGRRSSDTRAERADAVSPVQVDLTAGELEAEVANVSALAKALTRNLSVMTASSSPSDASLEALIAQYGGLVPGSERDNLLQSILLKAQLQIGDTRDLKDLAFFRGFLNNPESTRRERHAAMVVAHPLGRRAVPGILAYYEEGLRTRDSTVRAFAAEGLAWIQGSEQQRARERMRGLLFDTDPLVRQMVAGCLATIIREPKDADLLTQALDVETDVTVAEEILDALRALDPRGYRQRLDEASKRVKPGILPLVTQRLAAPDDGEGNK